MGKHPSHLLLTVLRDYRKTIIEEFRHFKRDPVNRKWVSHSAFSHTVNHFRRKLAEIDKLIRGYKMALTMSYETGVMYFYDHEADTLYFPLPK